MPMHTGFSGLRKANNMIQSKVQIGGVYVTRIAGELVEVEVLRLVVSPTYGLRIKKQQTAFRVKRTGTTMPLPKLRTAASLREMDSEY